MNVQLTRRRESEFDGLQASLDAYCSEQLGFDELRTQWIRTLADSPEMCAAAVRLLYQRPSSEVLTNDRTLTLKRIAEAALRDGPDDATIVIDESAPLESAPLTDAAQPAQSKVKPELDLKPGQVLMQRFVLGAQLGGGGVGLVFTARDRMSGPTGAGDDRVAIKVLREEYRSNPALCSALKQQALHAQALAHANVVRVHDFHEDSDTRFLTMEFVEGELLSKVISQMQPESLPRDRAMRIIGGMCAGLAHAHGRGLIHADFKPGNVMLARGDVPKILDFGLPSTAEAESQSEGMAVAGKTRKSPWAVTPAYSSGNLLEGGTPGVGDDIYSLCCVVYELLAGRHPYGRRSALIARELNLQPERIGGLTDLQWRTLAAGLETARTDSGLSAAKIQEAFTLAPPLRAVQIPAADSGEDRKTPPSKSPGLLLALVLVLTSATLFFRYAPSNYVDPVRSLEQIRTLGSSLVEPLRKLAGTEPQLPSPASPGEAVSSEEVVAADPTPQQPPADETAPDADERAAESAAGLDEIYTGVQTPFIEQPPTAEPPFNAGVFKLDAAEYFVPEDATALAVQITRSDDVSIAASVEWRTIADSAEPDIDYADLGPRLMQFAPGEEAKTIFIPIVSDTTVERTEYFRIALRQPGYDSVPSQPYTAIVAILDDDG